MLSIAGLIISAAVDMLVNLIAAAVQQRAFSEQFSNQSIWLLVGSAVAGILAAYLLSRIAEPAGGTARAPGRIRAKDIESLEGGITAQAEPGSDISVERARAKGDINISHGQPQAPPDPKAPPPA
jgi:hypothetical protein